MSNVNKLAEQWFTAESDLLRALFTTKVGDVADLEYVDFFATKIERLCKLTISLAATLEAPLAVQMIRLVNMLNAIIPLPGEPWLPPTAEPVFNDAHAVVYHVHMKPIATKKPDDLVTLTVVRQHYHVNTRTLHRAIHDGRLPSFRPRGGNCPHQVSLKAVGALWPARGKI